MTATHIFERLDNRLIPRGMPECRAVLVTLNEAQRLPWLLEYYRALGVGRFFVIDNGSTDGTVEFLLRQDDCHVFSTCDSYLESGYGRDWQQAVLDRYGDSNWWLVIDADEMFVYPSSESVSLPQFCDYLDGIRARGVSAFLLDMYSRGPVAEAVYRPGQPFLDVCPFFDTEYSFWPRPRHLKLYGESGRSVWQLKRGHAPLLFPAMEPIGGPRLRRFNPRYHNPGPLTVLKMKIFRHIGRLFGALHIKLGPATLMPAVLFKVPLIKAGEGVRLIDSHSVSPIPLAPVTGALLHFKFFSDFHERVVDAVKRGQHFDGGSEYARYLEGLAANPRLSFYYEKSAIYEDTQQLSDLGLIKDDLSFESYCRMQLGNEILEARRAGK